MVHGGYVVLKYECLGIDTALCKRLKMQLISCYAGHLVDPGLFPDWTIYKGSNDVYPTGDWNENTKMLLLQEGSFSSNCYYLSQL